MNDSKIGVPIRILCLEDSALDAELIEERMMSSGLNCDFVVASTKEQYMAAINAIAFDIIFCDYKLPDYDGLSALKLAKEKQEKVPVIMISGALGEEAAVECLQLGAKDYILKQRLERLPNAVSRALREVEDQKLRLEAEKSLLESENRFRQLAENSDDGFWFEAIVPKRMVLFASPAMGRIWGTDCERLMENPHMRTEGIHPDDRSRVERAWKACVANRTPRFEVEYKVIQPDGTIRRVIENGTVTFGEDGAVIRMNVMVRDVTERLILERQNLNAQRLEAIGQLAGGVAHDLNNTLAPILVATASLRKRCPEGTEMIDTLERSAKRGSDMVKHLLDFTKGSKGETGEIQTNSLLMEMERMIKCLLPKSIEFRARSEETLWPIHGDSTQLYQVLLNLCMNASDAMQDGGVLTICADNMRVDDSYSGPHEIPVQGEYVRLSVTDTGVGIPDDCKDLVFDPFFTTKEPEKGTGLGLSTVFTIVESHKGYVRLDSKPGKGSTFTVYLPAMGSKRVNNGTDSPHLSEYHGDGESILIVDDEVDIVTTLSSVLIDLNFKVRSASDGMEALAQVAESSEHLSVVLTDLHMPNMNGLKFVKTLKRLLPEIAVIVMSGRMESEAEAGFKEAGVASFIEKPFTQDQLTDQLKFVLERRPLLAN